MPTPAAQRAARSLGLWRGIVPALLAVLLFGDAWVYLRGRQDMFLLPIGPQPRWIVVPGASVRRDGTPSPILQDRLEAAIHAASAWPQSRLFLSGTAIPGGYSEPEAMRKWLLARSIAPDRMVLDRNGTDTRTTFANLGVPAGQVVVVSQDWHLPRALWAARDLGWTARGLLAPSAVDDFRFRLREHAARMAYFLTP